MLKKKGMSNNTSMIKERKSNSLKSIKWKEQVSQETVVLVGEYNNTLIRFSQLS